MEKASSVEPQPKENASTSKSVKRVRDEKLRKKDEKSLEHVFKALDSLGSTEHKLGAMCQKYAEIYNDHRLLQTAVKQAEKKNLVLQKEKEQLQSEQSKAILTRSRLENLCRELQRQNRAVKEECVLKMREEGEKKREVAAKFHSMLSEIGSLLAQNNNKNAKLRDDNLDMSLKLKSVCDQFEKKEQHVENLAKQMELEMQLADAKLAKARMEMDIERETLEKEKQQLVIELAEQRRKTVEMKASELALREQIAMYSEKYDEFHKALLQSNTAIGEFKSEMERMTKHIRRLEKETAMWMGRCESAQKSLAEVSQEKQRSEAALALSQRRLAALQGICRGLQDQCRQLRGGSAPRDSQTDEELRRIEEEIKEVERSAEIDAQPCPRKVAMKAIESAEASGTPRMYPSQKGQSGIEDHKKPKNSGDDINVIHTSVATTNLSEAASKGSNSPSISSSDVTATNVLQDSVLALETSSLVTPNKQVSSVSSGTSEIPIKPESAIPTESPANETLTVAESAVPTETPANETLSVAESAVPTESPANETLIVAESAVPTGSPANYTLIVAESAVSTESPANETWTVAESAVPAESPANETLTVADSAVPTDSPTNEILTVTKSAVAMESPANETLTVAESAVPTESPANETLTVADSAFPTDSPTNEILTVTESAVAMESPANETLTVAESTVPTESPANDTLAVAKSSLSSETCINVVPIEHKSAVSMDSPPKDTSLSPESAVLTPDSPSNVVAPDAPESFSTAIQAATPVAILNIDPLEPCSRPTGVEKDTEEESVLEAQSSSNDRDIIQNIVESLIHDLGEVSLTEVHNTSNETLENSGENITSDTKVSNITELLTKPIIVRTEKPPTLNGNSESSPILSQEPKTNVLVRSESANESSRLVPGKEHKSSDDLPPAKNKKKRKSKK